MLLVVQLLLRVVLPDSWQPQPNPPIL